jgi:hypothetical protein
MLSSSPNTLYDRLSEYRKESVASECDKRTGSVSSDCAEQIHQVHKAQGVPVLQVPIGTHMYEGRGLQVPRGITVDMYASDGRIDSVVQHNMADNNGASAHGATDTKVLSNMGKVQSTHSLFQQSAVVDRQVNLPSSMRQLSTTPQQHLLYPGTQLTSMTGSSPTVS